MNRLLTEGQLSQCIYTRVQLPAYDINTNGIMINLLVEAKPSHFTIINSYGRIAIALRKMFERVISIMSTLKSSWEIFRDLEYNIQSKEENFRVIDARSAGLPLCISLLNIFRQINGLEQVQNLVGTGLLRIDGSFNESSLEMQKKQAALQADDRTKFVNSARCRHVFDLANLMNCK
ncbi:MAG: hypothetical protein H0U73_02005 [Tatlockia sp.]|nr:hypothetical protein [Tatlockia sp.]